MKLWTFFDERARRLGILDTKLAQAAAMFVALIIAKAFPQIMDVAVWWFILLGVLCAVRPVRTFFGR